MNTTDKIRKYVLIDCDNCLWNPAVQKAMFEWLKESINKGCFREYLNIVGHLAKCDQFQDFWIYTPNNPKFHDELSTFYTKHMDDYIAQVVEHNTDLVNLLKTAGAATIASFSNRSPNQLDRANATQKRSPLFANLLPAFFKKMQVKNTQLTYQKHFNLEYTHHNTETSAVKQFVLMEFLKTLTETTEARIQLVDDLSKDMPFHWFAENGDVGYESFIQSFNKSLNEPKLKTLTRIRLDFVTHTGTIDGDQAAYIWLFKDKDQWKLGLNVEEFKNDALNVLQFIDSKNLHLLMDPLNQFSGSFIPLSALRSDADTPEKKNIFQIIACIQNNFAQLADSKQKQQCHIFLNSYSFNWKGRSASGIDCNYLYHVEQNARAESEANNARSAVQQNKDSLILNGLLEPHHLDQTSPNPVVIILSVLIKTVLAVLTFGILPTYAAWSGEKHERTSNLKLFFTDLAFFKADGNSKYPDPLQSRYPDMQLNT